MQAGEDKEVIQAAGRVGTGAGLGGSTLCIDPIGQTAQIRPPPSFAPPIRHPELWRHWLSARRALDRLGPWRMSAEEKSPDSWPAGLQLKTPPYTFHSSLEMQGPPPSSRKLVIMTAGAVAVLTVSIIGVLVATYLGRATCTQRDYGYLPAQVNVQNEASLLLALSELGEQGVSPGITCDLRNHLMVYHGQPEGCVARKMEPSDQLPSCQELESYFQAILRNASLGLTSDVQSMGSSTLGSLTSLLCSNKPTYLITAFASSPRHHISMAA